MPTWDATYMRMKGVESRPDHLQIVFANDDVVKIELSQLSPADRQNISWEQARIDADELHVVVPATPSYLQISWQVIRSVTDSAFARHMAQRAEKQARSVGERIRDLRDRRGLTQKEVATRAGIEPANLSRIEAGRFDVATSTLWKILAAMGYSPSDLADQPQRIAAD